MKILAVLVFCFSFSGLAHAEFVTEDANESGITGPSDSSWRFYRDQMDRFPDRVGIICYNAYILNKTPDHQAARMFFTECANRGHAASMINLAQFYTDGMGVDVDLTEAANWLRRAAELGNSAGELEYAKVLLSGAGVPRNDELAEFWLRRAAAQGDTDAKTLLKSQRIPVVAWVE